MRFISKIVLLTFLIFIPSAFSAEVGQIEKRPTILIGIAEGFNPGLWPTLIGPTLEYLRESLPGYLIKTKEVDIQKNDSKVQELDFFIAPPLFFWKELLEHGASAVGMLSPSHSANPTESTGAVLITRKDKNEIKNEKDLNNKTLAVREKGFEHDYLILTYWMKEKGLNIDKDLKDILEVGFRSPGVISAVLSGAADVGLLGYCELEDAIKKGIIQQDQIRVLSPRKKETEACVHTTNLYPNIVVGAYPNSSSDMAAAIAAALYKMPELPEGYRWSYPSGFSSLDEVTKKLALGPYAYLQEWRPGALWKRFSTEIILFISFILAVCWHIFRVNRMVHLRTLELKTALKEKELLSQKEKKSREQLSALERSSVISHISSLIAHELKQPLGAISNYSAGLKAHLTSGDLNPELVKMVIDKISKQSEQASSVIDFVRGFANPQDASKVKSFRCSCSEVVARSIESLKLSGNFHGTLKENIWTKSDCRIDPRGLELSLYNLLKNAAEATDSISKPVIEITVRDAGNFVEFVVADNGKQLSAADVEKIAKTTSSTKPNGLGLGIKIIQDIVEKAGGKLVLTPNKPRGLNALIRLPKRK
ncbi:MAG: PhnD/SsuA/transferrin family substrate-binding protein [Burkholderiales bacterium]|nr:PhnD/SsuA/transferrin family substrate-binding protein [Burkholderiales bacterium]